MNPNITEDQIPEPTNLSTDGEFQQAATVANSGTNVDPDDLFGGNTAPVEQPEQQQNQTPAQVPTQQTKPVSQPESGEPPSGSEQQEEDDDVFIEQDGLQFVDLSNLEIKPEEKAKPKEKHYATEAQMWQARYDKLQAETDKRIAELEARMAQPQQQEQQSVQQQVGTQVPNTPFRVDKTPADFMPRGFEDQYDGHEVPIQGSMSQQAYAQYQQYYQSELAKSLAGNVNTIIEQRERQRAEAQLHQSQINYLKDKVGENADIAMEQVLSFIEKPTEKTMHLLWMAMQIDQGRLPLTAAQFTNLRNRTKPKTAAPNPTAQSGGTGVQQQQQSTKPDDLDSFFGR